MTDPVHQANKSLVLDYWTGLDDPDPDGRAKAVSKLMADDVRWHGHAPVGSVAGSGRFLSEAWEPLMRSFGDLERETLIFFAGTSNGRVDGDIGKDGHHWVTGTGLLHATFTEDYLTIPATGEPVSIRWGEFCRVTDGRLVAPRGRPVRRELGLRRHGPPVRPDGRRPARTHACRDPLTERQHQHTEDHLEGL